MVDIYIKMEIIFKDKFKTIKPVVMVIFKILINIVIEDIGRIINLMGRAHKKWQVDLYILVYLNKVKKMDMAFISFIIIINMKEILNRIIFMNMVYSNILIKEDIKGNGIMEKCKEKELFSGIMTLAIKDNFIIILEMAKEIFIINQVKYLKENGRMAKSMAKVFVNFKMVVK